MELQELISNLIVDTKGASESILGFDPLSSVGLFMPEIVLCAVIVVMLLLRLVGPINVVDRYIAKAIPGGLSSIIAFAGVVYALIHFDRRMGPVPPTMSSWPALPSMRSSPALPSM